MAESYIAGFNVSSFASQAADITIFIVLTVVVLGIIGMGIWYYWREKQYKYLATVHYVDTSDDANKGFIKYEQTVKARKLVKQAKLHLKKFRTKIDIPQSDAWKRSGKTWKVYLQHDGVRMFAPSVPRYNSPLTFTPMSYQIMNAFVDEGKDEIARHAKQSWWDDNKTTVLFFTAMALSIAIVIIALENAQKIAEQMFNAAAANRQALLDIGTQAPVTAGVLPV